MSAIPVLDTRPPDHVGDHSGLLPSGRHEGRLSSLVSHPSWVAVSVVGLGLLSLLVVVANGWLLSIDTPLADVARSASVAGLARLVSKIGGTETAVFVTLILATALWRRCRAASLAIPLTIAVGALANVVLKVVIARPRPPAPETGTALASFPSGHTFQATLILGLIPLAVMLLTQRSNLVRWARVGAAVGIFAVAVSRVVLGAHWPTDVIAGVLVGVALLEVTHVSLLRSHRRATGCDCPLSVARI
jgi:undecaprenyl-diphosphatase